MIAEQRLHSAASLKAYKKIDPSLPDRIVSMAEREQQAQIDADLIPIRAEAFVYRFGATIISAIPLGMIAAGVTLLAVGHDVMGYVATAIGVIGGGAQFVTSLRPKFRGRSTTPGA